MLFSVFHPSFLAAIILVRVIEGSACVPNVVLKIIYGLISYAWLLGTSSSH
jgi:hypothetical protein